MRHLGTRDLEHDLHDSPYPRSLIAANVCVGAKMENSAGVIYRIVEVRAERARHHD